MSAFQRGATALAAAAAFAQTPAPKPVDNDQVHVFLATEQPHRKGAMHERPMNRVLIYLEAGTTEFTYPDGKSERRQYKAGDAIWSPAGGLHTSENITDKPVRIVEIELKTKPQAQEKSPVPALDPTRVDPKHYKLEMENSQVRIVRVRYGPGEKGPEHEHTLGHVIVYLNDQGDHKAGDFRFDGVAKHPEENKLDRTVERIVVDIK
jgi:quercetin dioxygenase-like cupin family protein